jgi:hypothetical protein
MPPEKVVMGAKMHVPTDPPEDGPPLQRPRQPSKPTVEMEPEHETEVALAATRQPFTRKESPPGGIKLEAPGGFKLSMPHAALLAILACFGGAGVAAKVTSNEGGDRAEMLSELRSIREELKGTRSDIRDIRDEQQQQRGSNKKILNYIENSLTPIVASMRKLGVKLEYQNSDPAQDVEFQPAPLPGSKAPPIQPRAVLPDRPNL